MSLYIFEVTDYDITREALFVICWQCAEANMIFFMIFVVVNKHKDELIKTVDIKKAKLW
jgi:hypothetical protein